MTCEPLELFAVAAVGEAEWAALSVQMRGVWLEAVQHGFTVFRDPPTALLDLCTLAMQAKDDSTEEGAGFADLARACLAALAEK